METKSFSGPPNSSSSPCLKLLQNCTFIAGDVGAFQAVTEGAITSLPVHLGQITESNAQ